jgi:hypothetical protein
MFHWILLATRASRARRLRVLLTTSPSHRLRTTS